MGALQGIGFAPVGERPTGVGCGIPVMPGNKNRMAWIRQLEELSKHKGGRRHVDYEFASECRITGMLVYADGGITCGPYTFEKDDNGLYHYVLRLSYYVVEDADETDAAIMRRVQDATSKGYYFQGGAVGELLSLFSLVLQCRFYLLASIDIGLNSKFEYRLSYRKTAADSHPRIFDERNRNFDRDLRPTLDRLRGTSGKHHQRAITTLRAA